MKRRPIFLVCLAGFAVALPGCEFLEPKVASPFTGQPVTEAALVREVQAQEAAAKAEAVAAADKAAREVREAQAAARRAAIDLSQRQATTAAELTAEAARVEAETGQRITAAAAAADAAAKALADRLALVGQQADAAAAELEAKRAKWAALGGIVASIPGVKAGAAAAGIDVSQVLSVILGGGMLYQMRRRKQDADANYDAGVADGKAAAEAVAKAADAAWDESQARLLALHAKPPTA